MRSKRLILPWIFTLSFSCLLVIAWLQRQAIFDSLRLRGYQPSAVIAQLATNTTMNDRTRRLFYVYHPELNDREAFNQNCPDRGEKTIVLGCYVNRRGIYLFDVNDPRLSGVEEVTAAHEILHAAYDRLSVKDKVNVTEMLNRAYDEVTDERIRKALDTYRQAGDDVNNEIHSILGTEVRDLPPELETYYSRYFDDRKKIVSFSENYEKEFTGREAQAESYLQRMNEIEGELPGIKREIDELEVELTGNHQSLERERQTTEDPAEFNRKVAVYNNRVGIYRGKLNQYNKLVEEHNQLVNQYNSIALEENELIKALDSRPATVNTQ